MLAAKVELAVHGGGAGAEGILQMVDGERGVFAIMP
jgi:hypothetical protein